MDAVLVLDANQRSALAVTRSLGKARYFVDCCDTHSLALAGASRYCRHYWQSPCPQQSPQAFLTWLKALLAKREYRWVLPMTEISSRLLLEAKEQFTQLNLPFANLKTVLALSNKNQLTAHAKTLGIEVPQSEFFVHAKQVSLKRNYPCVLKPAYSKILHQGQWLSSEVHIIHSPQALKLALKHPYFSAHPFMIQEFVAGHGAGVFCLYKHGRRCAYFAHQRLREKPPQGGVSVLSASQKVSAPLLEQATRLLDDAHWHGVAMVEFRIDPQGRAYLMEVNTRFWGSLQLAIDAGVDFPALLLSQDEANTLENYTLNQQLRWLLGDVDSLYLYCRDSNYTFSQKLRRIAAFFTPHPKRRYEINRWHDFKPALIEIQQYWQQLVKRA